MDVYLREIINKTNSHFDLESLEITCLDLFKAGAETTSTTLLWVIVYLVRYQEVQERCYQEILRETGEARPSLADSLPYCQAVLQEVQRLACVAPQTIPHRSVYRQSFQHSQHTDTICNLLLFERVTEQVVVEDYVIPKDSHAIANLWGFMKDPAVWSQPEEFRPERFLEDNKIIKHPQFVPFGIGRRACMGEVLQTNIDIKPLLYLPLTHLLRN